MRGLSSISAAVVLAFFCAGPCRGADVDSHVMTFDFQQIDEIEVSGSPSLTILSAMAGGQPQDATDSSVTYAITTNGSDKRITASIDTAMPPNVTFKAQIAAPSGSGMSSGEVTLGTAAVDVVTGISQVAESSCAITYRLSATVAAGVLPSDARTVTFTLTE